MRRAAEDGFGQGGEADLFPEKVLVLIQEGRFGEVVLEYSVSCEIAPVEGEEQVS